MKKLHNGVCLWVKQPTMSKKSFIVDYEVFVGGPFELCGAKVDLSFTVIVKIYKIKKKKQPQKQPPLDSQR